MNILTLNIEDSNFTEHCEYDYKERVNADFIGSVEIYDTFAIVLLAFKVVRKLSEKLSFKGYEVQHFFGQRRPWGQTKSSGNFARRFWISLTKTSD